MFHPLAIYLNDYFKHLFLQCGSVLQCEINHFGEKRTIRKDGMMKKKKKDTDRI